MNAKDFLNSMGDIDEKLIEGAGEMENVKKRSRARWIIPAAAAFAALAVGVFAIVSGKLGKGNEVTAEITEPPAETEKIAYADPTAEPSPSPFVEATEPVGPSMGDSGVHHVTFEEGFSESNGKQYLIYGLRYYEQLTLIENGEAILGEQTGEVTELVEQWRYFETSSYEDVYLDDEAGSPYVPGLTPMPYTEHTGSRIGPIYALNGYDTEYVVAQKYAENSVIVYYNVFGEGADNWSVLYRDALRFSDGAIGLGYMDKHIFHQPTFEGDDIYGWVEYVYKDIDPIRYGERIDAFMEALSEAEWRPQAEVFGEERSNSDFVGYLNIRKSDGMNLDLVLRENGHIRIYDPGHLVPDMVLCIDASAADGIADLVRGKYTFEKDPPDKDWTLAEAAKDPWLGEAVPPEAPEHFELKNVYVVSDKEADGRTTEIGVQFRPDDDYELRDERIRIPLINIDIEPPETAVDSFFDGEFHTHIPIGEFTRDDLAYYADDEQTYMAAFVTVGGAAARISVTAWNEEADMLPDLIMEVISLIMK